MEEGGGGGVEDRRWDSFGERVPSTDATRWWRSPGFEPQNNAAVFFSLNFILLISSSLNLCIMACTYTGSTAALSGVLL